MVVMEAGLMALNHAAGNPKVALLCAAAGGFCAFGAIDKAMRNHFGLP